MKRRSRSFSNCAAMHPGYKLAVDLEKREIRDDYNLRFPFEVDDFRRHCLLNGLDDIGMTLEHEAKITAYELAHHIT